eukprot:TRINITY_DN1089_c0_g2_i2.p1 TRINITY_DN1089_c0_g2~~TRINITY_DN1089_c0_g2_i2.p1  ORF type:complete len:772 (-),score=86.88 TRINITY_DN1089_c0_g2_i2:153-2468(-)
MNTEPARVAAQHTEKRFLANVGQARFVPMTVSSSSSSSSGPINDNRKSSALEGESDRRKERNRHQRRARSADYSSESESDTGTSSSSYDSDDESGTTRSTSSSSLATKSHTSTSSSSDDSQRRTKGRRPPRYRSRSREKYERHHVRERGRDRSPLRRRDDDIPYEGRGSPQRYRRQDVGRYRPYSNRYSPNDKDPYRRGYQHDKEARYYRPTNYQDQRNRQHSGDRDERYEYRRDRYYEQKREKGYVDHTDNYQDREREYPDELEQRRHEYYSSKEYEKQYKDSKSDYKASRPDSKEADEGNQYNKQSGRDAKDQKFVDAYKDREEDKVVKKLKRHHISQQLQQEDSLPPGYGVKDGDYSEEKRDVPGYQYEDYRGQKFKERGGDDDVRKRKREFSVDCYELNKERNQEEEQKQIVDAPKSGRDPAEEREQGGKERDRQNEESSDSGESLKEQRKERRRNRGRSSSRDRTDRYRRSSTELEKGRSKYRSTDDHDYTYEQDYRKLPNRSRDYKVRKEGERQGRGDQKRRSRSVRDLSGEEYHRDSLQENRRIQSYDRSDSEDRYKYQQQRLRKSRDDGRLQSQYKPKEKEEKKSEPRPHANNEEKVAKIRAKEAEEKRKKEEVAKKPIFGLSGKLAEESNQQKGVVMKYQEPPEAARPALKWRFYVFKNDDLIGEPIPLHRQSCYIFGRDRLACDVPLDHPMCSKQHAVLQYRKKAEGEVAPYIMDLKSSNGTLLNGERIEAERYFELMERDMVKFGLSSREYILLHEKSQA